MISSSSSGGDGGGGGVLFLLNAYSTVGTGGGRLL